MKKRLNNSQLLNYILAFAVMLCSIFIIEVSCRIIGIDFENKHKAFYSRPPFDRLPTFPVGDVYFRRPGPEEWSGKILSDVPTIQNGQQMVTIKEVDFSINYDSNGFRNPENLNDWDIVVIGDSFTELGYLPTDKIFTTELGRILNQQVKNLGVCGIGPCTYLYYLKNYGIASKTKHAVMVFCEGNDLEDLRREVKCKNDYDSSGIRTYRNIEKQSSFLKAVYRYARQQYRNVFESQPDERNEGNAYFIKPDGNELPVKFIYSPTTIKEIPGVAKSTFEDCLVEWAEISNESGMTPWLVYIPTKRHVMNGHIRFRENARQDIVDWNGTDLPGYIAEISEKNGINFIDVTPELKRETALGNLTYSTTYDSHLNEYGSHLVAIKIASELKKSGGSN
jgi:hypothetical protein